MMISRSWKAEIHQAVLSEDHESLRSLARAGAARVIRFLNSRLYTNDEEEKARLIRALGVVAGDASIVDHERATDLLRRFAWALNDESGAVPYGVPEAIGEVLAVRSEFQEAFLPVLCSLLTEDDMSQTGSIERGALWAVGRVGPPVGEYSGRVVEAVKRAAEKHADPQTRAVAARSLERITATGASHLR